ncbi:DUF2283 domain-containing protein [Candidatus Pacearchaeota archaeon]|nr:DUF2283 domain-containing protein [Candidatus Pacearchaeota archaeon]
MKNYEYAEDLDLLYINNIQNEKEKVIGTINLGNIIFDIGEGGKILGVEIDCASRFLRMSPSQIINLKTAKIDIIKVGNALAIGILLATEQQKFSVQYVLEKEKMINYC